jgi:hypothetical protein
MSSSWRGADSSGSIHGDPSHVGDQFAAERFSDAEHVRRTSFAPPPSFRLAKYLQGAFGVHVGTEQHDVVVEFSKARATSVTSRIWHESPSIESLADGRVGLRFTCTNLLPVGSWVLEWGPHARATAPDSLVQSVKRELDEARALY